MVPLLSEGFVYIDCQIPYDRGKLCACVAIVVLTVSTGYVEVFNDVPISVLVFATEAFFTSLSSNNTTQSKLVNGRLTTPSIRFADAASDLLMWLQEVCSTLISACHRI